MSPARAESRIVSITTDQTVGEIPGSSVLFTTPP